MNTDSLFEDLIDVISHIREGVLGALPDILGAILLFAVGLVLASVLRAIIKRLLHNMARFIPFLPARRNQSQDWIDPSIVNVIGGMVYWIVVFLFLTASTELLGLPVVTTWLSGIANYLPRILTAALIIASGFIGANMLRAGITRTAESMGIAYAGTATKLARMMIILLSILIAVDLVGLDISLLANMIYLLTAALLFGAALAFGLGSKNIVANILASYYLQKTYEVGQVVRMGSLEGRIIQITPTALILQTSEEQVMVPAKRFSNSHSSLLKEVN